MRKIDFIGNKFSSLNKARCNKILLLTMKMERVFVNSKDYRIEVFCKKYKITVVKIFCLDREIQDALKMIFTTHADIIIPAKLRYPNEFIIEFTEVVPHSFKNFI